MTLFLNNDDVKAVLTMEMTIEVLEEAYQQLARGEAACPPPLDIDVPGHEAGRDYRWGQMCGASRVSGYFAIRMKSDVRYEQHYEGVRTSEYYCVRPGRFCGLIFLTSTRSGEPLALINDGYLQHFRSGADSAIGSRYMAREESSVLGVLGSGGMARSHVEALRLVRPIRKVLVSSPTRAHREAFASEVRERYGLEVIVYGEPRPVYDCDILSACTDAALPVIRGEWLKEGTHVTSVGGSPDDETVRRITRSLRLGTATAPIGLPHHRVPDERLIYSAFPEGQGRRKRAHGIIAEDRAVYFEDLLAGRKKGRLSAADITYSERGNVQGAQFFSVGSRVYELARQRGLGRELPTEWFLQDIRN
ncbi:MAG: ornithine cyclodeaminase family protein [Deltaproteobacteria bacterium]|nr:ornithine cyclodeaminase family protein [Deltaproteobacteria bacterium]